MANSGLILRAIEDSGLLNSLSDVMSSFLSKPGDRFEARVTASGRQVIKATSGNVTYSATRYPKTGTLVETRVTRYK